MAGRGSLYLGELDGRDSARVRALQEALSRWGAVQVTANIWGYLWGKMGYANMLFATALADETMADVIDRYRPLMVELAGEIYEVAAREGVHGRAVRRRRAVAVLPARAARAPRRSSARWMTLVARRRRDQKSKSGIWRDLAVRRRKTEVDQQIGLAAADRRRPRPAHAADAPARGA